MSFFINGVARGPAPVGDPKDPGTTNVVSMFLWRELRANAAMTAAQDRRRQRPDDPAAEHAMYDAAAAYVRAARQRNEVDRRARQARAQALADSLRDGSYPGGAQ
jgi:hypothetical protein